MRVKPRGLLALRAPIALAFVFAWNLAMVAAVLLNGDLDDIRDAGALSVLALTTGVTSLLAWSVVLSAAVRRALFAPTRADWYEADPFVLVGAVTALICVACMFAATRDAPEEVRCIGCPTTTR